MIIKTLIVGPIAANCYIVGDPVSKQGMIVDPGSDASVILEGVGQLGLDIQFMIVTHGHFDHCGAVAPLKSQSGWKFLIHSADLPFIRDSKQSARKWGFDIDQVPEPDKMLVDEEILRLGDLTFKILHTPGHSPGGICMFQEKEQVLFSGDTLFYRSIGRTDFAQGSLEELTRSIQTRIYTLPDSTRIYPGHGEPTAVGEEKKFNCFVRQSI